MDGPDYLQRSFSMWSFLITAWQGQGLVAESCYWCWWHVSAFPGVLGSSLAGAIRRDGSSVWLHITTWLRHLQTVKIFWCLLWLWAQSSGFEFSCPQGSINSKLPANWQNSWCSHSWEHRHCILPQISALHSSWNGRKWRGCLAHACTERAKTSPGCSRTSDCWPTSCSSYRNVFFPRVTWYARRKSVNTLNQVLRKHTRCLRKNNWLLMWLPIFLFQD